MEKVQWNSINKNKMDLNITTAKRKILNIRLYVILLTCITEYMMLQDSMASAID